MASLNSASAVPPLFSLSARSRHAAANSDAIAINARHASALGQARDCLVQSQLRFAAREPTELLASNLRCVLEAYGVISGCVDSERMLDALFSEFCIGK